MHDSNSYNVVPPPRGLASSPIKQVNNQIVKTRPGRITSIRHSRKSRERDAFDEQLVKAGVDFVFIQVCGGAAIPGSTGGERSSYKGGKLYV